MKEIIQSYTQSVEETHIQIGEVSSSTHTCTMCQTFLCGCLTDLKLCLLGSLCVISISVIFDLSNHLTENQEVAHSSLYTM